MIFFDERNQLFHMTTPRTSYIIGIEKGKYLAHLYWGRKLASICPENAYRSNNLGFSPNPDVKDKSYSLDTMPQEYPSAFMTVGYLQFSRYLRASASLSNTS